MSVALVPQFSAEMDDSMMQEDHPADASIHIDVDSVLQPETQGDTMEDLWAQSQPQDATDEFVDVEYETEHPSFYEPMEPAAVTEVEMGGTTGYNEGYEYEMSYEDGNYYEDVEVLDHPAPAPALILNLPPEMLNVFNYSNESLHQLTSPHASEALPTLHPTGAISESPITARIEPVVDGSEPPLDHIQVTQADQEVPGVTHETAPEELSTLHGYALPLEATHDGFDDISRLALHQYEGVPWPTPELSQPDVAGSAEEQADAFDSTVYHESESDVRYPIDVPPILLSLSFGETGSSRLLAVFNSPDMALVPSSSSSSTEFPQILLENQPHIFLEPITVFLSHVKQELVDHHPNIIPPEEFEYKELQITARDLQLTLTEDNIYSREYSLLDFVTMHQSCGLSGYLHLDLVLQPRFIDRYQAIRQALEAQVDLGNKEITNTEAAEVAGEKKKDTKDVVKRVDDGDAKESKETAADPNGDSSEQATERPDSPRDPTLAVAELAGTEESVVKSNEGDEEDDDSAARDTKSAVLEGEFTEANSPAGDYTDDGYADEGEQLYALEDTSGLEDAAEVGSSHEGQTKPGLVEGEEAVASQDPEGETIYVHEDEYVEGDDVAALEAEALGNEAEWHPDTGEEYPEYYPDVEVNQFLLDDEQFPEAVVNSVDVGAQPDEGANDQAVEQEGTRPLEVADDLATTLDGSEEAAEFDEEAWDDEEYTREGDETIELENQNSKILSEEQSVASPEEDPNVALDTEAKSTTTTDPAPSPLAVPPRRPASKRSIRDVEADDEEEFSLSPGSKRARHL